MGKWLFLSFIAIAGAGCSNQLETGYDPTKLGMSMAQRRALYSDPYTQESQNAQQDQADEAKARRPVNN